MRRALRIAGISLLLLIGLLVVAYGVIHVLSNNALQRQYPVPVVTLVLTSDPASLAEGQRLVTVRGCYLACTAICTILAASPNRPLPNAKKPRRRRSAPIYRRRPVPRLV